MTLVIDVVLPCLDEAGALPWLLKRMPDGFRAIVVDNGSTDGSPRLAGELGAQVVLCERRGYGAACHAGLEAATADIVVFCDCDGSVDPVQLVALADPVRRGTADIVVARRRPTTRSSWPIHARVANLELARQVRRRTGLPLRDLGPVRVARRIDLLALKLQDRRSGYPLETVLRAAQQGWRVVAADVDYAPRTGKSKVTGTVRGTLQWYQQHGQVLRSVREALATDPHLAEQTEGNFAGFANEMSGYLASLPPGERDRAHLRLQLLIIQLDQLAYRLIVQRRQGIDREVMLDEVTDIWRLVLPAGRRPS